MARKRIGLTPSQEKRMRRLRASRGKNISMLVSCYLAGIRQEYLMGCIGKPGDRFEESSLALFDPVHWHSIKTDVELRYFGDMDVFLDDLRRGLCDAPGKVVNDCLKEYAVKLEFIERVRKYLYGNPHAVRFMPKTPMTQEVIAAYSDELSEKQRLVKHLRFLKRQERRRLQSNRFLRSTLTRAELRGRTLRDGKDLRAAIAQLKAQITAIETSAQRLAPSA